MGPFDVPLDDERTQLDAFVEEYRRALDVTLDGLGEEQARRRLVPSATTLLGLLKHVTWMQRVWFEECVGGTSRRELGLVQTPDESFRLTDGDTVASVTAARRGLRPATGPPAAGDLHAQPRTARSSRCIATSVERSRTSERWPGSTGSRASTTPSAVVTQKQT